MADCDRPVRLPGVWRRLGGATCWWPYIDVIGRIPDEASGPWEITSTHLRAGATVEESKLWPTAEYPRVPLLFEKAGPVGRPERGHRRRNQDELLRLWVYEKGTFVIHSEMTWIPDSWAWPSVVRPWMAAALRECAGPQLVRPAVNPAAIAELTAAIDQMLSKAGERDRLTILTALHEHLARASVLSRCA